MPEPGVGGCAVFLLCSFSLAPSRGKIAEGKSSTLGSEVSNFCDVARDSDETKCLPGRALAPVP